MCWWPSSTPSRGSSSRSRAISTPSTSVRRSRSGPWRRPPAWRPTGDRPPSPASRKPPVPMSVHQVLVGASPGDAVTDVAFDLRGLLRRIGPSEIFAQYIEPELVGDVFPLRELAGRRADPGDALVYHASIGEPDVAALLLERPEPLVMVFHNMTPSAYFAAVDPHLAARLAGGWVELAALAGRVDLALADSKFNAADLAGLGYAGVEVWPLPLDPAAWLAVQPDAATAERLAAEADRPLVLFVGQLLPHKRPDLLLSSFCVLQTYLVPEARLAVVGWAR